MPNDELVASWRHTRAHLDRAWVALPADAATEHSRFREALDHNELELAMEALAETGTGVSCPPDFWLALADAAAEMQLSDAEATYRSRAG